MCTFSVEQDLREFCRAGSVCEDRSEADMAFGKRKIFDASQAVNGFTEKILAQKAVVKDIEAELYRMPEQRILIPDATL